MGEKVTKALTTSTVELLTHSMDSLSTGSLLLSNRVLRPSAQEVMGRDEQRPIAPLALAAAAEVFTALRSELSGVAQRTAVTPSGEVTLTFFRERRYGTLTADADGELILTLSDRSTDDEAEALVVGPEADAIGGRIKVFLER